MKYYVIIVAGGKGLRMGNGSVPKQFIMLNAKPVLSYSLEAFANSKYNPKIIVVLPQNHQQWWVNWCAESKFNISHQIITGGAERFYSVKNGLQAIEDDGVVAIHDGVRPFVSTNVINNAYLTAKDAGSAIPVVHSKDSIRLLQGEESITIARESIRLVQTPQCFNIKLLKAAYQLEYNESFTDDASVFEKAGHSIKLIDGNAENIKITTPFDLVIAESFIKRK